MAKEKQPTVEQKEQSPFDVQPFEIWKVKVTKKARLDENFEKVFDVEIEKDGDKPIRVTHISNHHAEILNSQAENTKQYYYPKN